MIVYYSKIRTKIELEERGVGDTSSLTTQDILTTSLTHLMIPEACLKIHECGTMAWEISEEVSLLFPSIYNTLCPIPVHQRILVMRPCYLGTRSLVAYPPPALLLAYRATALLGTYALLLVTPPGAWCPMV